MQVRDASIGRAILASREESSSSWGLRKKCAVITSTIDSRMQRAGGSGCVVEVRGQREG